LASRIAIGIGLLTLTAASPAAAQLVLDYNLLWNNSGTGTLAGQFSGAAGAGAPACAAGFSAATLGTSQFSNNTYANPLLSGPIHTTTPDFRPAPGSPAFGGQAPHGKTARLPANGFFLGTCYVGALPPLPEPDWTQGWTYYDSLGAGRTDLHYDGGASCNPAVPAMPDPRPCRILDNHNLYVDRHLSNDTNYVIRGQLRVKDQAALHIEAGTVIFEERATVGTIVVERGGKIFALGTAAEPIIITTDLPPGQMVRGSTGGIVINGRARTNIVNSCAGDSAAGEGGLAGFYGGNDDDDNSGVLRYVRVEYAGREISPNNELNSFTFNGVGRNTTLEYLQAHAGGCATRSAPMAPTRASTGSSATAAKRSSSWSGSRRPTTTRPRRRIPTRASRPTTTSSVTTRRSARDAPSRPSRTSR
jgi:hypothetical protein